MSSLLNLSDVHLKVIFAYALMSEILPSLFWLLLFPSASFASSIELPTLSHLCFLPGNQYEIQ